MHPITLCCRIVTSTCELADAVNIAARAFNTESPLLAGSAFISFGTSILGFAECGGTLRGCSHQQMSNLKITELCLRTGNLFFTTGPELNEFFRKRRGRELDLKDFVYLFEKVGIAPISALVRTAADLQVLDEQCYLSMSPEELSKVHIPIHKGGGEDGEIIGYRSVTPAECETNLLHAQAVQTHFATAEALSHLTPLTFLANHVKKVFQRLGSLFDRHPRPQPNPLLAFDPLNLKGLHTIPEALYNDIVLGKYICPITHQPIRYPVADPHDRRIVYERQAIENAIQRTGKSPTTHTAMRVDELVPVAHVELIINQRLEFYENGFHRLLEEGGRLPPDLILLAAANRENPPR